MEKLQVAVKSPAYNGTMEFTSKKTLNSFFRLIKKINDNSNIKLSISKAI